MKIEETLCPVCGLIKRKTQMRMYKGRMICQCCFRDLTRKVVAR